MYSYGIGQPYVSFPALGRPVPQGQLRHLGKGRPSIYGNQDILLPWRDHVIVCARMAIQRSVLFPIEGPVGAHIWFTWPKPKSAPKTRVTMPDTQPDLDKLVRTIFDALQQAGVVQNDSQFVALQAMKVYPGETPFSLRTPGVRITVYGISGVQLPEDPPGEGSGDEGWDGDRLLRAVSEVHVPRSENCTCHCQTTPRVPQEPLPVPGQ